MPETAPLARIQDFFRKTGLWGQCLTLEHRGETYRVSCDEEAFLIYRVNRNFTVPPGAPGWPVVMINSDGCFDECRLDGNEPPIDTCGLSADQWLAVISRQCLPGNPDSSL